jgi:hypothetical protein
MIYYTHKTIKSLVARDGTFVSSSNNFLNTKDRVLMRHEQYAWKKNPSRLQRIQNIWDFATLWRVRLRGRYEIGASF